MVWHTRTKHKDDDDWFKHCRMMEQCRVDTWAALGEIVSKSIMKSLGTSQKDAQLRINCGRKSRVQPANPGLSRIASVSAHAHVLLLISKCYWCARHRAREVNSPTTYARDAPDNDATTQHHGKQHNDDVQDAPVCSNHSFTRQHTQTSASNPYKIIWKHNDRPSSIGPESNSCCYPHSSSIAMISTHMILMMHCQSPRIQY